MYHFGSNFPKHFRTCHRLLKQTVLSPNSHYWLKQCCCTAPVRMFRKVSYFQITQNKHLLQNSTCLTFFFLHVEFMQVCYKHTSFIFLVHNTQYHSHCFYKLRNETKLFSVVNQSDTFFNQPFRILDQMPCHIPLVFLERNTNVKKPEYANVLMWKGKFLIG